MRSEDRRKVIALLKEEEQDLQEQLAQVREALAAFGVKRNAPPRRRDRRGKGSNASKHVREPGELEKVQKLTAEYAADYPDVKALDLFRMMGEDGCFAGDWRGEGSKHPDYHQVWHALNERDKAAERTKHVPKALFDGDHPRRGPANRFELTEMTKPQLIAQCKAMGLDTKADDTGFDANKPTLQGRIADHLGWDPPAGEVGALVDATILREAEASVALDGETQSVDPAQQIAEAVNEEVSTAPFGRFPDGTPRKKAFAPRRNRADAAKARDAIKEWWTDHPDPDVSAPELIRRMLADGSLPRWDGEAYRHPDATMANKIINSGWRPGDAI